MFVSLRARLTSLIARRHGAVVLFVILFAAISVSTRLVLLVRSLGVVSWDVSLLAVFAWGVLFDLASGLLWAVPLTLGLMLLPQGFFGHRWARALVQVALVGVIYLLLFGAVAEWIFWDEFSVRFNFIAVDYLVYSTEVIANIRESYPIGMIFAGIAMATAAVTALWQRTGLMQRWLAAADQGWRLRYQAGAAWIVVTILAAVALNSEQLPAFANNYNRELAKNGLWSLFAAFRNNQLDYDQFYSTVPVADAFRGLQEEFAAHGSAADTTNHLDTLRYVPSPRPGPELRLNVIQITVESLSADFVSGFNRASRLTPNLEALAAKSLVFENFYATGTRTDRGMEALTLGIPPTPGRSLVKRPRNENLFTLGSVFRSRNYDTAFIYGGYGYFDNMNYFFGNNGYRVIDRASVSSDDISFANAWGACDEDVFRWTLREADQAHAAGKPFHFFVMTTSNHRPFTYPEGKIDLPSKISGRAGAVKYTDYAIGQLLANAASHPWFKNTIFVIVADHCASVAGRAELPVQNYHIPLFIYAPGGQVAPGRVRDVMSQIDYPPTLLGLLNWGYGSRFFGWDVVNAGGDRRALIGNYQKLGLYQSGELEVLRPVNGRTTYRYDGSDHSLTPEVANEALSRRTIGYYQAASYLYRNGGYTALTTAEQAQYAARAHPPSPTTTVTQLAAVPSGKAAHTPLAP